ncbi:MAG: hypothetical protein PVF68_05865 [Acidobacteriota bacterium]
MLAFRGRAGYDRAFHPAFHPRTGCSWSATRSPSICNENSYSNAEIISQAFKTLERGTLAGQETWSAAISTGGSG